MNNEILGLNEGRKEEQSKSATKVFGTKIPLFSRIFGCWHFRLCRPMTVKKETYCVCVKCGARIRFDTENLKTFGSFFYPPQESLYPDK